MLTATIVVADTHELFAQGLRHLLEAKPGLSVIDLVNDGFAALETCRQRPPHLLMIDAMIGGLDAMEVCRQLRRYSSPTRVLVTMPHTQYELTAQAMKCGAQGVVLKSINLDKLYTVIESILAGEKFFPSELTHSRGRYVSEEAPSEPNTPYSRLTARERTVFKLLAEGHSVKQVASHLELKPKTVDVHKTNLMRKLDVHDRSELIHFAFREGLIDAASGLNAF
ncbi:MAG: response regulator transcription factor [Planctomycetes bacterium]|nr:response regulator transcription factor [Planctomycetota bacterium]